MGDDPLTRLADIELPAAPDWQPLMLTTALAVLLVVATGWWLWRMVRRSRAGTAPRRSAGAHVDTLLQHWQSASMDDREASYHLANTQRLGLGLDQLDSRCPAALAGCEDQWQATLALLQRLRYQRAPNAQLSSDDFLRIRQWVTLAQQQGGHAS